MKKRIAVTLILGLATALVGWTALARKPEPKIVRTTLPSRSSIEAEGNRETPPPVDPGPRIHVPPERPATPVPIEPVEEDPDVEAFSEALVETLQVPVDTARRIARILADRDEEAERILAPYETSGLTREALLITDPSLRVVEETADSRVLGLLDAQQQQKYREARESGVILGVRLLPLPEDEP